MAKSSKLMLYWQALEKKFIPSEAWQSDLLTLWRERIVFAIYFSNVVLGPVALVPSLTLAYMEKLWHIFILDFAAYGIVLVLLFSPGFNLKHKTWGAFLIFYGLGTALLFMLGFYGAGYIWLFGASVIVGSMIGLRAAVIALLMNFLSLMSLGIYISVIQPSWAQNIENVAGKWMVLTSNFMLINSLVTIMVAIMLTSIKNALIREQHITSQLEKRRQELMAIFRASPDPVVVYNDRHKVRYTNDAFSRVFGWSLDEIKGDRIPFIPEDTKNFHDDIDMDQLDPSSDETVRFETRRMTKAGEKLDIELSAAPIRQKPHGFTGIVVTLKDVTRNKKLEAQLQQAQKMEAIGTLTGGIAHDFNNILHAIGGFTQFMLMTRKDDDPDFNDLNQIMDATRRGAALVKQLMLFSRKVQPEKTYILLNPILEQTRSIMERTLPRMVAITLDLCTDPWSIKADPVQMEQMLLNLAINAVDAIQGEGTITIRTENVVLDHEGFHADLVPVTGNYVKLTVSDTGHGISPEIMPHIFEPFFTSKEIGKGTGLGLSSVYGIVKNHQGYIHCKSRMNHGTQFTIHLPAFYGVQPEARKSIDVMPVPGKEETILLVDDDHQILEIAGKMLNRNQYNVMKAESGEMALDLFERRGNDIDLVILDIGMPGMGGHECLVRLKKMDPKIKIIIASGYFAQGPVEEAIQNGVADYIAKPFQLDELLTKIRKNLPG